MSARARVLLVAGPEPDDVTGTLARALRDAGAEVIYTAGQSAEQIAHTALQEDVDAVGVLGNTAALTALLADREAADIAVFAPDLPLDEVLALLP